MNPKRLFLAILAVFCAIFATDLLIHGLWMEPVYKATMPLWRTDDEMMAHMSWLYAGQLLAAVTFVLIWAKGFAATGCRTCAIRYGLGMALFSQATTLISYAVQPLTTEIVWKWMLGGVLQGVVLGLVVSLVYRPAPAPVTPGNPVG